MEISAKTNQEVASKFRTEQSRELQLLARGRHDPKLIENHLLQPDPAILTRVTEDQNKEYKERTDKSRKDQSRGSAEKGQGQQQLEAGAS